MPRGGRIPNQGNQPQAPGIGRDAKRHDLEAGATPGLGGPDRGPTDLQFGDVQELEQGQQIVNQATGGPQKSSKPRRRTSSQMDAPDPISFIAGRSGGQPIGDPSASNRTAVDVRPWMPLIEQVAARPNVGGAVGAAYVRLLMKASRTPINPRATVIDRQELDEMLMDVQ
jgi:hypothetical protein